MSTVQEIEKAVQKLPVEQALALQDWLADYLEDAAELNSKFVASIERGKADLQEKRTRVRQP
jgi:hypothetical protein